MAVDPFSVASAYANASRFSGGTTPGDTGAEAVPVGQPNFADFVQDAIRDAAGTVQAAESEALQSAAGGGDIVDVVTAISAAEMTIETVVAVRDKVVTAYQEIMRMPI